MLPGDVHFPETRNDAQAQGDAARLPNETFPPPRQSWPFPSPPPPHGWKGISEGNRPRA